MSQLQDKGGDELSSFNKTVLENGLTVITESIKGRRSVHAGLHLLWGSRHEKPPHLGMAHLIEHMVFKGTKKRTAYDIVKEIESVGAEVSACTGKEMTSYTVQCLNQDLKICLEVLADITQNAVFNEDELKKEKQVVLSEIAMGLENLEESVFEFAFEKIYKDHGLSHSIAGTKESVSNMDLSSLQKTYNEIYRPENFVLSAAGDIEHEELVDLCKQLFQNKNNNLKGYDESVVEGSFAPFTDFYKKESEQSHVLVNFPAPAYSSADRLSAYLVNTALGGGMTSILFQKIREDMGLSYSIYSLLQCFLKEGVLSIYLASPPHLAMKALTAVLTEVEKLIQNGMNEEAFILYKNQLKGEIVMGEDDLENRMNSLAVNEFVFGDYKSVDAVIAELNALTLSDVNNYLKEYMDQEPGVFILGSKIQET